MLGSVARALPPVSVPPSSRLAGGCLVSIALGAVSLASGAGEIAPMLAWWLAYAAGLGLLAVSAAILPSAVAARDLHALLRATLGGDLGVRAVAQVAPLKGLTPRQEQAAIGSDVGTCLRVRVRALLDSSLFSRLRPSEHKHTCYSERHRSPVLRAFCV